MTKEGMIQFLRLNLDIPDSDNLDPETLYDPLLLQMTDEELLLYLNIALSQEAFAEDVKNMTLGRNPPPLSSLELRFIYRLMLVTKRLLYFALATRSAPKVDLGADNNNYLRQNQRFEHYMKLIAAIDEELKRLGTEDNDGGGGTGGVAMTYDTTLVERYYTPYNQQKRPLPQVRISIARLDDVIPDVLEVTWKTSYISKFFSYKLWVSKTPILVNGKISPDAKVVFSTHDPHERSHRLTDTEESYYIAVSVTTLEGLTGYDQVFYEPEVIEP